MREITVDTKLIAYCGLYCGACKAYIKEKCPRCHDNVKASWCKVRSCCIEHGWASCADCSEYDDVYLCKKYNNIFARVFGFIFRSDRKACIDYIKKEGYDSFASHMADKKIQSFPRS